MERNKKNRILRVWINRTPDDSPDTLFLGEYTDTLQDWAIVREGEFAGQYIANLPEDAFEEIPDKGREFRFFVPYAGGEEPGTKDYQTYGLQDFERMESLNNGGWYFLGIIVKAEVVSTSGVIQIIRSGGLWGIESDSGTDYLEEVEKEELAELRTELESFGFGERAIDFAFKSIEHKAE